MLIAPENVYEHEVDASMEVQDLQALVEAEVSVLARTEGAVLHSRDIEDPD